jgi:hypothetical protein
MVMLRKQIISFCGRKGIYGKAQDCFPNLWFADCQLSPAVSGKRKKELVVDEK